jgi:hypothetical protein
MIALWLDDVRPMPPQYTHLAKTAAQAIEVLKTRQVCKISLDHDLGEGNGTGYDVAKWIEEHAFLGDLPRITGLRVHTDNPVGRQNINAALRRAYSFWNKQP